MNIKSLLKKVPDLKSLLKRVPGARTGYQAIVDGKIINGCCDCGHNYEKKTVGFLPPTHYCNSRIDDHANDKIVFDPFNIPEDCPFKVIKA